MLVKVRKIIIAISINEIRRKPGIMIEHNYVKVSQRRKLGLCPFLASL